MSVRRGGLDYTCELCRAELCYHRTFAARIEVFMLTTVTCVVWSAQVVSAATIVQLVTWLGAVSWHSTHGAAGKSLLPTSLLLRSFAKLLPPPASIPSCGALASVAVSVLAAVCVAICIAWYTLSVFCKRPVSIHAEGVLAHLCVVKIGACIDVLLYDRVSNIPASPRATPPKAFYMLASTIALDMLLLAFVRVPREHRKDLRVTCRRLFRGMVRILGDLFPYAAMVFLWTASIVMIAAASVLPCIGIVCHEAFRDSCRRRHRHGTIQMVALVMRFTVPMLLTIYSANAEQEWIAYDSMACVAQLALELTILLDVSVCKRGIDLAWNVPSQILWTMAVAGHAAITFHSSGASLWAQGGAATSGPGAFGAAGSLGPVRSPMFGARMGAFVRRLWSGAQAAAVGRARPLDVWGLSTLCGGVGPVQALALAATLLCYLYIHFPVAIVWRRKAWQLFRREFGRVEPDKVVFHNHPCHRLG